MSKKSFEEQFPGYDITPPKEAKWKGPLLAAVSIAAMAALAYGTLQMLGGAQPPVANMSGVDAKMVRTLKNLALVQAKNGDLKSAAKNFEDYFRLGGDDPEAKRAAESVQKQLGN